MSIIIVMSITRQGPLDHLQLGAMSKPIFSSPPHMNLSMFQLWGVTTSSMWTTFICQYDQCICMYDIVYVIYICIMGVLVCVSYNSFRVGSRNSPRQQESERSLRGRSLDLQLGHGTKIEHYPAKVKTVKYLNIACMKTNGL